MRRLLGTAAIGATLLLTPAAYAQKATEQCIPIGQSPGISGKYSYTGKIASVDRENRIIVVKGSEGPRNIKITDSTKIWIDRSRQKKANPSGSFDDMKRGRRVEVNYTDYEAKDEAAWIKIEI